ncbi:Zn(2)-C6 fungal-type DNA-binding domain protein [Metarhizium rileyi]|uniref:Zn(2)-C6 fungal-type DNA-binding domain protein n=1 Tax=Metarhizium rileyi (strain RCEF 4871) TaxID=1649241 RepID=A0A162M4H2_METRR|nr:Zn(2)-C6 fungal-type DNA-binding domain protein [Metarhizium rileyi RCEF 4871]
MEKRLSLVTDGETLWAGDRGVSADDGVWQGMVLPSPSPTETAWKGAPLSKPLQTGQLSPVSSGVGTGLDSSSVPTTAHSVSSSCTDSWSIGYVEQDDEDNEVPWETWEHNQDEVATAPKLEPNDDDVKIGDVTVAPLTSLHQFAPQNNPETKQKRPRGRPRKHPHTPAVNTNKVTKGRSKTGCITCRKRKKKCDEAKPRCMNCEKNAVVCEGYHEKQIWKSGKEKAEEERIRQESQPIVTMQPIFHGVETAEDMIFWKHYISHLSNVLTVEGEAKNAFKDIILQLANQHQGLMHSILAVSSKHIDLDSPYGAKVLQDNPAATPDTLQRRGDYHHEEALRRLYKDMENPVAKEDPAYDTVLSARYGQILCLLLQTRAEGNPRGEHRVHLQAYQTLIQHSPPENNIFHAFITEFFQYHIYADDLLWHSGVNPSRLSSDRREAQAQIHTPRLIGVGDGLFRCLSQITSLRNAIRSNVAASVDPVVDYTSLYRAAEIDAAIRDWTPKWPLGDSRHRVGPLYKQMMWIYLFRTIYPPSTSAPKRCTLVTLPVTTPQHNAGNLQRRASMVASVGSLTSFSTISSSLPSPAGPHAAQSCPSSRNPSRTSSMHEQDTSRLTVAESQDSHKQSSPPPVRRPAHDDCRITLAVEESLAILESFQPCDPAQTLLLIPCTVIGTACFDTTQRRRVRTAIKVVRGYTGLRSSDRVMELLEEVWSLMDRGDWASVWDWQLVAKKLGLDFLCA